MAALSRPRRQLQGADLKEDKTMLSKEIASRSTAPAGRALKPRPPASPSPQYAITVRMEYPHAPGWIAMISGVIAEQGGAIQAIDLVRIHKQRSLRDYTIECTSAEQEQQMIEALKGIQGVSVRAVSDNTFLLHVGGKLEVRSQIALNSRYELSMTYTPGVARVCKRIQQDPRTSFHLTIRKNCIAVVSDGSAVLGLGNIGAEAAMPVMEGKAILFKEFG